MSESIGKPPDFGALSLCPLPRELAIPQGIRALVFAPHPDDETIGCGGTLAQLAAGACAIRIVVVTDGAGAGALGRDAAAERRSECRAALEILGAHDVVFLDEPDGAFRHSARFERTVAELLQEFSPAWVFLPSPLDYHRDHVALSHTLLDCLAGAAVRRFLYEVWAPLPATWVVDITSVMQRKLAALACHRTPLAHLDYRGASEGLSAFRGLYLSRSGAPRYAEAFLEVGENEEAVAHLLQLRWLMERTLTGG